MSTNTTKTTKRKTMTKARTKTVPKIDVKHPGTIVETIKGDTWIDTLTLSLMLGVTPYTWTCELRPRVEEHYGDCNRFRRSKGRNALWNWRMIHRWYMQRPAPKRGCQPRYLAKLSQQKLEARGAVA